MQALFHCRLCNVRRRLLGLYHCNDIDAPKAGKTGSRRVSTRRVPVRSDEPADMTQMILVYLGTIFKTPEQQAGRENDKTEKIVTYVTLIVGLGTSCPLDRSEGSMLEALADVGQS